MGKLFENQVVIVTGAGNGIGREEALSFAREGAKVVVNDVGGSRTGAGQDSSIADSVVDEIRKAGGDAVAAPFSVSERDGADNIVWSALNKWGRVDVLVNNAGILRDKSLVNMTDAEWDAVIAVHLKGTFLMSRAFARAKKTTGGSGAIVNTSSLSGLVGNYGQTNYSAAKAGIYGITRTTSMELAKMSVRVNAIAPVAYTRMTEDVPLLKQMGVDAMHPSHVAVVVVWLASALAAGITGRVFGVHGTKVFEYAMQQSDGLDAPPDGNAWTPESLTAHLAQITFT
jgi:NAD(P)-dependent dehydrogenase (short-subunit alcohol dehydrogenase family)